MDKKTSKISKKLAIKRKHVYVWHQKDSNGTQWKQPAMIINARKGNSVIWTGTNKPDKFNKEKPLILYFNEKRFHFYGNGINKIKTKELVTEWKDKKTNESWILSKEQQIKATKKFIAMSPFKNPYSKIKQLEAILETKENKIKIATNQNYQLSEENKQLKQEIIKKNKNDEKIINISLSEYTNLKNSNNFEEVENKLLKQKLATTEKIEKNNNKELEFEKD
ncbi:hypothetical protein LT336_00130 [Spiroplasma sp. JKS002671]|uniref:hypothetical protein n=1 Tax=Spiroplasma attinicola TaxID=2904537 RepID=UPI002022B5FE|nr:hypothetical protein [Spiroplasma sp. JKS002671]MCL8210400.1 hypothetical protein [Spiroplasma sp. JKS002671]